VLLSEDAFKRLCWARELLCAEPERALSVREAAVRVEISQFHFIRQFEAVFGMTPRQLQIRTRIDRARRLLALGELSVTGVCLEVGFSSLGSFSDSFTRRVGESPSAYRRRVRTLAQVPAALTSVIAPGCLSLMAWLPESAASQFPRSVADVPVVRL
jgi:AraC-like DNA-binding protein